MIKTTTQNDVLRYMYNEATCEEKQEIEDSLAIDHELMEFHRSSVNVLQKMKGIDRSPSERSINNIMAYVRSR